ncbi:hypothetical protein O0L34_g10107 [Tuta absoluta]|nr:hypothetical protein O0L34_g10107 [Tuta absoluta]
MRVFVRSITSLTKISFPRVNSVRLLAKDVQQNAEKKIEEVRKNIIVEKFGGVTTINIDRQKCRNSLDEATLREIEGALQAFDQDNDAKVLVINGEGGSFCSGFDIDELGTKGYNALTDAAARLKRRPLCDKPTIAAVAGYAVAEGFELALACDLRVIEETACLGFLGRRFGVPQSLFGARRITSLIGLSQALDLLMTGRLITGEEAYKRGLGCKVTATGTSLGESIKLAKSLTKFPQSAMMMDKLQAVNSQLNPNSEDSMRDEALAQSLLGAAMEDIKQGVAKFQGGIGKHGKFYKLTEVPLKDWEVEESFTETAVMEDPEKKKKD